LVCTAVAVMIVFASGQTERERKRERERAVCSQQREDNSTENYETDPCRLCLSQFFSLITHRGGWGGVGGEVEGGGDIETSNTALHVLKGDSNYLYSV